MERVAVRLAPGQGEARLGRHPDCELQTLAQALEYMLLARLTSVPPILPNSELPARARPLVWRYCVHGVDHRYTGVPWGWTGAREGQGRTTERDPVDWRRGPGLIPALSLPAR